MEFLNDLNLQQYQAVTAGLGPVLVLAGPGSGKTRVLTQRIAYLISELGVQPYHILAVTFTNKAAKEMESRVVDLVGSQLRGLTLGTFHATCARIMRVEAEHLPIQSNYVIFDTDDQLSVIKRALEDLNLDNKKYKPQTILASISNAKSELLLPDEFLVKDYLDEIVKRVYVKYQELLLASNAVDFDDLLLWTAYLFEGEIEVREKYARRFEHVLVDEFQDTNLAQYRLLRQLASWHHNLFVVGDTDQSIYAWRGADYRNLLRFERDYPDTQVVLLETNYRSTQAILDVAMSVIDRNPHRTPKQLNTSRGIGEKVILHETYDDREEASYVIDKITELVARRQSKPGDFAVMYRTNAQSRLLEEAFLHANLPYKLVGAQRFYGRKEIKDVIAFLRLAHNPNDDISLARVINVPARGIGAKSVLALRTQSQKTGISQGEILLEIGRGNSSLQESFPNRMGQSLARFGRLLADWQTLRSDLPPLGLMDRIIEDTSYREYIDDETDEGRDRWENVMELRRLADEFSEGGLGAFLERIALVSDQDTIEIDGKVPTLLTLHAAKGLEFRIVFIVGLSDGMLPHIRSFDEPESMQEERRLFYVGITRAKDQLFLVSPLNRSSFGYSEPVDESRFLNDIPSEFLAGEKSNHKSRRDIHSRVTSWDGMDSSSTPITEPKYTAGAKVVHPVWGEGMVLNSRIQDDDEIVDVFFEGEIGLKRLAVSLARLQLIT